MVSTPRNNRLQRLAMDRAIRALRAITSARPPLAKFFPATAHAAEMVPVEDVKQRTRELVRVIRTRKAWETNELLDAIKRVWR